MTKSSRPKSGSVTIEKIPFSIANMLAVSQVSGHGHGEMTLGSFRKAFCPRVWQGEGEAEPTSSSLIDSSKVSKDPVSNIFFPLGPVLLTSYGLGFNFNHG